MQNLYTDLEINLIVESHPYESDICNINKQYNKLCRDRYVLNMLRDRWVFPDFPERSRLNLTYQQIAEYSLFYYPVAASVGKYHPVSLYYQSSLRYTEEDCEYFFNLAVEYLLESGADYGNQFITCCLIADAAGHFSLLSKLYDKFIVSNDLSDEDLESEETVNMEILRKQTCVMAALCLEDDDKLKRAMHSYFILSDNDHQLLIETILSIDNIYIPNYDLKKVVKIISNLLIQDGIEPIYSNTFNDGLFSRNTSSLDETELGLLSLGADLSICLSDEFIKPYSYGETPNPIPEDYKLHKPIVADYWSVDNFAFIMGKEDFLFPYRPDLMTEDELLHVNEINYIRCEHFGLYFLYSGKIVGSSGYYIENTNHLNVPGYNIELTKLAAEQGVSPTDHVRI